MPDAVHTYAGPLAWWDKTSKTVVSKTIVEEGQFMTGDQLRVAAGLDFEVVSEPVFLGGNFPGIAKNARAIRRASDGELFYIGTPDYKITQPGVVVDLPQSLIDDGSSEHFETGGTLFGGKIAFSLLSLHDKEVLFDGDPTPYDMRLLTSTGFDGKHATEVAAALLRVVCANTWTAALKGAPAKVKVRHTGNQEIRLGEMRHALKITLAYKDRFVQVGNELFKVLLSDSDVDAFLEALYPVKEGVEHPWKTLAARESIKALYKNSDNLQNLDKTGYRMAQAVGEYLDHEKSYGKGDFADDRRALAILEGSAYDTKTKAIGLLVPGAVSTR